MMKLKTNFVAPQSSGKDGSLWPEDDHTYAHLSWLLAGSAFSPSFTISLITINI